MIGAHTPLILLSSSMPYTVTNSHSICPLDTMNNDVQSYRQMHGFLYWPLTVYSIQDKLAIGNHLVFWNTYTQKRKKKSYLMKFYII